MELRVLGCHGGESTRHRTSSFLIDGRLAIDAGALTGTLDLHNQVAVETILVSHAHMDHIRDLATLADNRCQAGGPELLICSTPKTVEAIQRHFFNDRIWPDFAKIPSAKNPTIRYKVFAPGRSYAIGPYTVRAVLVSHTVESAGFVVSDGRSAIAYSGDTGPTKNLWKAVSAEKNLKALLMEVSFPNRQQKLATVSGHHTPQTLVEELKKLSNHQGLPVLLYHIKPSFDREVEAELAAIRGHNLKVLRIGDTFQL